MTVDILYQASRLADHSEYNLIKTKNDYDLAIKDNYDKLSKELEKLNKDNINK